MTNIIACCFLCTSMFFMTEKIAAQEKAQDEQDTDNGDLDVFARSIKKLIAEGRIRLAARQLRSVDPEAIARAELENEKPRFIRLAFFITETPGVHQRFASKLSEDEFVTIGWYLDDALENEIDLRMKDFPDATSLGRGAREFAHKYNLLLFYLLKKPAKDAVKLTSFEECRKALFLSKEEWEKLPLVSRLAIQELISDDLVQDQKQQ